MEGAREPGVHSLVLETGPKRSGRGAERTVEQRAGGETT
jgi:hypothetical protein